MPKTIQIGVPTDLQGRLLLVAQEPVAAKLAHLRLPDLLPCPKPAAAAMQRSPTLGGYEVFFSAGGVARDAQGTKPADQKEMLLALRQAGRWIRKSQSTGWNLIAKAGVGPETKAALVDQIMASVRDQGFAKLSPPEQQQMLAYGAAVLVQSWESLVAVPCLAAAANLRTQALSSRTIDAVLDLFAHEALPRAGCAMLARRVRGNQDLLASMSEAQRVRLSGIDKSVNPWSPIDYEVWDERAAARPQELIQFVATVNQDIGDGMLRSYCRLLRKKGLGHGIVYTMDDTTDGGRQRLFCDVPADHELNKWGRPVRFVKLVMASPATARYEGVDRPDTCAHVMSSHSNLGLDAREGLRHAPSAHVSTEYALRFQCYSVDGLCREEVHHPSLARNTAVFLHKGVSKPGFWGLIGTEMYETEVAIDLGILQRKPWVPDPAAPEKGSIAEDVAEISPRYGHATRNCLVPGDRQHDLALDSDQDGIANAQDWVPDYGLLNVDPAAPAEEFLLRPPAARPDDISGERAFDVLQLVSTAALCNEVLRPYNMDRQLMPHPEGIWFSDDTGRYVDLTRNQDGSIYVRMSTVLAAMSTEGMRAMLAFALKDLAADELPDAVDRTALGLVFVVGDLWLAETKRAQEIYEGVCRAYGIDPAEVPFETVLRCRDKAAAGFYAGDRYSVRRLVRKCGDALGKPSTRAVP